MPDDFAESLRTAAGIPTTAEKQAKADEAARKQAEWEANEPQRNEASDHYKTTVTPLVNGALDVARGVAKEIQPPHEIVETSFPEIPSSQILARRSFQLQIPVMKHGPAAGQFPRPRQPAPNFPTQVGTLHLTLLANGTLAIEVPEKNQLASQSAGTPIKQVGAPQVQDGFRKLLAKAKR